MDLSYFLKFGPIWYAMFLLSILFHKFTHAFISAKLGDTTSLKDGLKTINPVPHIKRNIIGLLIFPIIFFIQFGFVLGWADTPFNSAWGKKNPKHLALMMLSGPLANLVMLIIFFFLISIFIKEGILIESKIISFSLFAFSLKSLFLSEFLCIGFSINLILFLLNILPLPSLDGSAIILFFTKKEKAVFLIDKFFNKKYGILSGIVAGILFILFITPIHESVVKFIFYIASSI
jgi:Zn-dependent protease